MDRELVQRTLKNAEPSSDASRTITVTASDESVDRYGSRILVDGSWEGKRYGKGWQLENFKRNPVFMPFHSYGEIPLGTASVWTDATGGRKRLRAKVTFAASNPLANAVLDAYREGVLRSVSVGFWPLKMHEPADEDEAKAFGLGRHGVVFAEQELWEISAVSIPANPNAIVEGLRCDQRSGLCRLANIAEGEGYREPAYAIRSALGTTRRSVDLGGRSGGRRDRADELLASVQTRRELSSARMVRSAERALEAARALKAR